MRTRTPPMRRPAVRDLFDSDISVDLFAGGGGASVGTEAALGRPVDIAINHDRVAIAVHAANHPTTAHYQADIFKVDPCIAVRGRHVRHLHASPDCRHHSRASGGKPKSDSVRSLADVVIVWADKVRPDVITLENVAEFEEWGPLYEANTWRRGKETVTAPGCPTCGFRTLKKRKPSPKKHKACGWKDVSHRPIPDRKGETFRRWKAELEALGYVVEHRVLHAHHYGAPTSRKRFFLVARCDGRPICWPEATHGPGKKPYRTAASCIDWSIPAPSIFTRKKPLAAATLRRVAEGIRRFVLENPRPFIISIDHQSSTRADRSTERPLSTISTKARHCIVAPQLVQTSYGERKGQAPRVLDLHKPLGTIVAGGVKHAVVETKLAAFLSQYNLGQVGHELGKPVPTITAIDHHALVNVQMVPMEFAEQFPNAPAVLPFLISYFGSEADIGQQLKKPLRTITTRDRFALVTVLVDGVTYAIVDIGLRMLRWHELLKAQFGKFAKRYDLSAAKTEKDKVRLIGNSVAPNMQEAVVRANLGSGRTNARRAA